MRRRMILGIMLTLLIVSTLTFTFKIQPATANLPVHNINTELDYPTIQGAINAHETLDGHTILVDAGTYYEFILVDKALTLIGESRSNTIINGSGLQYLGALVTIEADNVDFSGFTVTDALNEGIMVWISQQCEVRNNTVTDAHKEGMIVWSSQLCEVRNNIVCFTGDRGIRLEGGGNNTVYNNIVYNSGKYGGIEAINSDNNTIYNNIAYFNQWGIATNHGSYNRIFNNEVYSNGGTGIHVDHPSTDNVIYNNDIISNGELGICVMNHANRTVISYNRISGSSHGIHLEDSFANNISENYITDNAWGVTLNLSENNTFYHNNFINNGLQMHIAPSMFNVWDDGYPHGGNYWSDYAGYDLYSGSGQDISGSDGIGDVPYIIDANNTDNYPLMRTCYYKDRMTQVVSTESEGNSLSPSLAVESDGTIHVVWFDWSDYDGSGTDSDIFYKRYEVGSGWTSTEVVSTESTAYSGYPSLAVDLAGNVHIAWYDDTDYAGCGTDRDIFYKRYEVGSGWTVTEVVSTESTSNSHYASLAVDSNGNVHVSWSDWTDYAGCGSDSDIFYKRFEVGSGWTVTEVVSTESTSNSWDPSLAADLAGNVHIAWTDLTNYQDCGTDQDIFYKRFEVGSGWTVTEVVSTESTSNTYSPSLAVGPSGNIHVAWHDFTDYVGSGTDGDIFYKKYAAGSGWTVTEVVSTESTVYSYSPSLAVDLAGNVHIVWYDGTDYVGCGSDTDIFYKRFEVGSGWTVTEVVSTESTELSEDPSLAVDSSGNVHITWHDDSEYAGCGSDTDIFYKYIRLHSNQYVWPMFRHTPRHTGFTESPAPDTNQIQWNYTTGGYVRSSPAVADGIVYVESTDGKVYALDQHTGTQIWNCTCGGWLSSSPATIPNNKVYVTGSYGMVYCINAKTGAHIWNQTIDNYMYSSPTVADDKIYIGAGYGEGYGKICCLDAATGVVLWNYTTYGYVESSPAVANGKVYVGSGDGRVYCLDALTGAHIWNYPTGDFVESSPAVAQGKVYVGSGDGKVYCLDASTGAHIWNQTIGDYVQSSPAIADGKIYIGSGDIESPYGIIYCLDALTGAHIWNYPTGDFVESSPAVAQGKVYVGSDDNKVYCLDALTGAHIWNYTTGSYVYSSPAVADGMVFIGSHDHTVYAFGNTIRVPEDYSTIQAAIDAANGTLISVAPGIYHEHLVINKSLTLMGRPGSTPIFEGDASGIAITIIDTCEVVITNIAITNYDIGILITNSQDCTIYATIMDDMGSNGLALNGTSATNNTIRKNIFQYNPIAINLTQSSTNNIIYQNTISENYLAINLTGSNNNKIYHNNFIDNTLQVDISGSSGNVWHNGYPSGGNYWSTHTTIDDYSGPSQNIPGSDGIVDEPYVIDGTNEDSYPLVNPFSGITIIDVTASKTIVGQGYGLDITVKVLNYGAYDADSTINVYVEILSIYAQTHTLTSRTSTTITFLWNTGGLAKGNYTITAEASPIPDETDLADNTHIDGWFVVTILGDVNGDGEVDVFDKVLVGAAFGATYNSMDGMYWHQPPDFPEPCIYCPHTSNADINGDSIIDIFDKVIVGYHFGETDP